MSGNAPKPDRRVQRTKELLVKAFSELFFERRFDEFGPAEIAERANVGRSTFYKHFQNKDELLRLTLGAVFGPLADACVQETMPAALPLTTAHLWENRRRANILFDGGSRTAVFRALADLIEDRLPKAPTEGGRTFPRRLVAAQLAAAELGLIEEWVEAKQHCAPERLAELLHAHAYAATQAVLSRAAPE